MDKEKESVFIQAFSSLPTPVIPAIGQALKSKAPLHYNKTIGILRKKPTKEPYLYNLPTKHLDERHQQRLREPNTFNNCTTKKTYTR